MSACVVKHGSMLKWSQVQLAFPHLKLDLARTPEKCRGKSLHCTLPVQPQKDTIAMSFKGRFGKANKFSSFANDLTN